MSNYLIQADQPVSLYVFATGHLFLQRLRYLRKKGMAQTDKNSCWKWKTLGAEKINDSQLGCGNCRMHEILTPLESLCHLLREGRWLQSTKSPPVTAEKGAQLVFPIPAYTILKTVLCHSHSSWPTRALFTVAGCIFRWPCMWLSREKWGKTVPWDFPALYTPPQTTTAVRVQEKRQKWDISFAQMYPAARESVCNLINILIASTTG